jgi:hypothetical protein
VTVFPVYNASHGALLLFFQTIIARYMPAASLKPKNDDDYYLSKVILVDGKRLASLFVLHEDRFSDNEYN